MSPKLCDGSIRQSETAFYVILALNSRLVICISHAAFHRRLSSTPVRELGPLSLQKALGVDLRDSARYPLTGIAP